MWTITAQGPIAAQHPQSGTPRRGEGGSRKDGTGSGGSAISRGSTGVRNCYRCGHLHEPANCPYKTYECHACKNKGHLKKVCGSRAQHYIERQNSGDHQGQSEEEYVGNLGLFHRDSSSHALAINDRKMEMEIDTGSARTMVSRDTLTRLLGNQKLTPTSLVLRTFSGETLKLLGTCLVEVTCGDRKNQLELLVADVTGQPSILGRDWLSQIQLDWKTVFNIQPPLKLEDIPQKHGAIFQLGTKKDFRAEIGRNSQVHEGEACTLCTETKGGRTVGQAGERGNFFFCT